MSRYIDADKLTHDLCDRCDFPCGVSGVDAPNCRKGCHIIRAISDSPTADVKEVKHGKWTATGYYDGHRNPIYQCSVCGKEVSDYYINLHKHCLHCGARMEGSTQ